MAGEEAGRHPEERNGEGKRLVGYCEERLYWKLLYEEGIHREGRQVQSGLETVIIIGLGKDDFLS